MHGILRICSILNIFLSLYAIRAHPRMPVPAGEKKKLAAVLATSVRFEELRRIHCYSKRFEGHAVIPSAWDRLSNMEALRGGLADPMRFSVFQALPG